MGFKRKAKQYKLIFEGDEFKGDESSDDFYCLMGSLSVDEFIEITGLATRLQSNNAEPEDVGRMFDILAEKIVSWNLEDDNDNPVPHDAGTLRSQDFDFIMAIQMAWMSAMAQVPAPLLAGSNNGAISQEDITQQLANLSRNLPS